LAGTAEYYRKRFGVDVTHVEGGGAAGGLAGGLFALGATLRPGFELVAEETGFFEALDECDVVVTGEGRLDATSFEGKVVGEVAAMARKRRKPVFAVCGDVTVEGAQRAATAKLRVASLRAEFGDESMTMTRTCITKATQRLLGEIDGGERVSRSSSR
jgi:glycerate kinase